jgi:hypothetical protein
LIHVASVPDGQTPMEKYKNKNCFRIKVLMQTFTLNLNSLPELGEYPHAPAMEESYGIHTTYMLSYIIMHLQKMALNVDKFYCLLILESPSYQIQNY